MPYDLKFSKDDQDIRVEVKGSTLSNVSVVDVTENEILHSANSLNSPRHAIHDKTTKVFVALVENIKINQKYKASRGELVHFDYFKTLEISSWREFSQNFFSNSNVKLDNNCKFKLFLDRKIIVS